MTSLLFRTIPKRDGYLYGKSNSVLSSGDKFDKPPNCTDGIRWILDVLLLLYFEFTLVTYALKDSFSGSIIEMEGFKKDHQYVKIITQMR